MTQDSFITPLESAVSTPGAFTLTPVHVAHARLLAATHHICFTEPWTEQAFAELCLSPGCFGFIVEGMTGSGGNVPRRQPVGPQPVGPQPVGPQPVGMVMARVAADEAEILTIAVLPPARRSGAGKILMQAALREAMARGAHSMFLEAAVTNDAALKMYYSLAFTSVGRRKAYYANGIDALVLRREM